MGEPGKFQDIRKRESWNNFHFEEGAHLPVKEGRGFHEFHLFLFF